MSNLFYVVADVPVFVWKRQRPGITTVSRERFLTLTLAVDACQVVAQCYCGLFRCPDCGTQYDPTWGKACPNCGSGGNRYSDVLPDSQREDYIGE